MENEKRLAYRPGEVAKLIGVSDRKMDELIQTGQIKSFKIDKCRRITATALEEFIKKQEKATAR
jgi:excisionase family DNA binding protein